MVSFVKEVYASFWLAGRGPRIGVAFAMLPIGAFALAYAPLRTIQVDFGLKDHQIAQLSILNTVAAAVGCIAGRWLGDRFGSRRIVALAYALTIAPTLILGVPISGAGLQSVPLHWLYGLVLCLEALFAVLVILVVPFLRDREEQPGRQRLTVEPLLARVYQNSGRGRRSRPWRRPALCSQPCSGGCPNSR